MSKTLAIFGATGQQGTSVLNFVLNDPSLSQTYKIRAITRDVESPKAQILKEKVEVIKGDFADRNSLATALTGVHTVFAMTTPSFESNAVEIEFNQAKAIADIAVERGVEYIIFSTLPGIRDLSGGKYTHVTPFDAKAKAEKYIRSLSIKSAFVALGGFMENFHLSFMAPQKAADGIWVIGRHSSPQSKTALIDAVGDTGKFVGAILAEPENYEGKTFWGAVRLYTWEEVVAAMAKSSGKKVVYKQIPVEEFRANTPFLADSTVDVFDFIHEYGAFGPGTEEKISWAIENARGKLITLEEHFDAHPLVLE